MHKESVIVEQRPIEELSTPTSFVDVAPLKSMVDQMLLEFFEEVQIKHTIKGTKLSNEFPFVIII